MYLFDIDGTILLSGGVGSLVINRLFEERFAVQGVMDDVSPSGKTDEIIFQECAQAGLSRRLNETEMAELLSAYIPLLRIGLAESTGFRLMPHVVACLDFLAEHQPLIGIATGNVEEAAMAKLDRAGLRDRFHFGGYASDAPVRKGLVGKAMERGSEAAGRTLQADEFVVIGDTVYDIEAARDCGARVIAVATGHVSAELLAAALPDALFETLEQLPDWHFKHFANA